VPADQRTRDRSCRTIAVPLIAIFATGDLDARPVNGEPADRALQVPRRRRLDTGADTKPGRERPVSQPPSDLDSAGMSLHLFAGLRVRDFQAARPWYERLLGEPTFFPHATEAVWTLAEDRSATSWSTPTARAPQW
jgi:hypothetical protein